MMNAEPRTIRHAIRYLETARNQAMAYGDELTIGVAKSVIKGIDEPRTTPDIVRVLSIAITHVEENCDLCKASNRHA